MNINEIRKHQPTINIGMLGSVANGKSTTTESLTGIKTQKHSDELGRNITIKLGYANGKIFKCKTCPSPEAYQPFPSNINETLCKLCNGETELIKHISIVDCPGHTTLMATLLNGTCVTDTSIIIESANSKEIPSQQTVEHLNAAKITDMNCSFVCLNKIDLVDRESVSEKIEILQEALKNTIANNSKIIPISANFKANIDVVCQMIAEIPEPERDFDDEFKMVIIRSFNVNYPDCRVEDLVGGVIGGSIVKGVLKINDEVKIVPGIIFKNKDQKENESRLKYRPITSTVKSINSEKNSLEYAVSGGLIGVGLTIDPCLTVKDSLVGKIVIPANSTTEYKIYETIKIKLELLPNRGTELKKSDRLIINCHAANIYATIERLNPKKNEMIISLEDLICVQIGEYVTLCTNDRQFLLIGRGKVIDGLEAELVV